MSAQKGQVAQPSHRPRRRFTRRQVRRRRLVLGTSILLVIVLALCGVVYAHLNGNLRTLQLRGGGTEQTDSAGDAPINVLVIGSDTRASAADCRIGGDCSARTSTSTDATSTPGNADVEMLVHLSADRSNATVLSIPRDTVIELPACTDPSSGRAIPSHRARINSSLLDGPSCTVAAVHRLTGVTIDHFVVVDFAGVVSMSNAVGGVPVCVNRNVYDPYSHLKLAKGTHQLSGLAALEFLRTRHGFGDGSDLGRESAQHLFLASMLRRMESASTLVDPARLYRLADAATKAITVDKGLGSVKDLVSLAEQLGRVPGGHISFLTMPTRPSRSNPDTVVPATAAAVLFRKIADDVSLTPVHRRANRAHGSRSSASTPTARSSPRTTGAASSTVDSARDCVTVGEQDTVSLHGQAMTPSEAYADSPAVPVSAP